MKLEESAELYQTLFPENAATASSSDVIYPNSSPVAAVCCLAMSANACSSVFPFCGAQWGTPFSMISMSVWSS